MGFFVKKKGQITGAKGYINFHKAKKEISYSQAKCLTKSFL
jgi:hypothetical protein